MQRSTETHHVLMFDVSECADTWINDHFFPASGAPRLGTHRRMVSRDAYFHRFYHFVGRTPKGHRLDRRATMNASADYAIAEVSAAPDSVVATSDLSFAVRAGRAPFRIDALDPMAVSVVYEGASFAVGLGAFLSATKTGYEVPIQISLTRLTRTWPRSSGSSPHARKLLTFVCANASQRAAMAVLVTPTLQGAPRVCLEEAYAASDQTLDFRECWEQVTAEGGH